MDDKKYERLFNALWKTTKWFLFNGIFCLLPFTLVIIINSLNINVYITQKSHEETKHILKDGVFVLFFIALAGAIATDIIVEKKLKKIPAKYYKYRWHLHFMLIEIPILLLVAVCAIYIYIVYSEGNEDYFLKFSTLPRAIIWLAFSYCFIYKLFTFIKEKD